MRVNIKLMMNFGIILKVIFGLQNNGFVDQKAGFLFKRNVVLIAILSPIQNNAQVNVEM